MFLPPLKFAKYFGFAERSEEKSRAIRFVGISKEIECTAFHFIRGSVSSWASVATFQQFYLRLFCSRSQSYARSLCEKEPRHASLIRRKPTTRVIVVGNNVDENGRRNSSLITTCAGCGRRHRERMSVKVYPTIVPTMIVVPRGLTGTTIVS